MSKIVLILLTIVFTLPASSHEPEYSQRTDIIHILDAYSEKTGVKFVADPRVKAQVNMIGLKVEDIEKVDLVEILLLHAFVAYEKNAVVYVIPKVIEAQLGAKLGSKW